jgi:hypothetical protein
MGYLADQLSAAKDIASAGAVRRVRRITTTDEDLVSGEAVEPIFEEFEVSAFETSFKSKTIYQRENQKNSSISLETRHLMVGVSESYTPELGDIYTLGVQDYILDGISTLQPADVPIFYTLRVVRS